MTGWHMVNVCRGCGESTAFAQRVLTLGEMALTGRFPSSAAELVPTAPLNVVQCGVCKLLQLRHSVKHELMYGRDYGYRSALNPWMASHLWDLAEDLSKRVNLRDGDVAIDIGCNDGTFLKALSTGIKVGIDPLSTKPTDPFVHIAGSFPDEKIVGKLEYLGLNNAKLITSIAMLYDVEDIRLFMRSVRRLLADEGLWYTEQVYPGTITESLGYDAVCHEHLTYPNITQLVRYAEVENLHPVDIHFNNSNGGSFGIVFAKSPSLYGQAKDLTFMLARESAPQRVAELASLQMNADAHATQLRAFLLQCKQDGKTVLGLGASTKGNVLLQHARIDADLLPKIGDVNADKWGHFTPSTRIPIVSQDEVFAAEPDYFLVLPWHFKSDFIQRLYPRAKPGAKFVFPLPHRLQEYP